jgi:hypothetical protein
VSAVILRRLPAVLALIGTTVVLAGCYGSTEPATNVTVDSATLHGRGTADQGSTPVWFQYWPTARPDEVTKLDVQTFGGETGPVSKGTHTLAIATNYSFRMCGSDQTIPQGACAQTRTFTTLQPAGDLVRGNFFAQIGGVGHDGTVEARSDTGGAHPGGTITLPVENTDEGFVKFSGAVTCVLVQGNRAAVGAVGTLGTAPRAVLLSVIDQAPYPGGDQTTWTEVTGATPPNCSTASFAPTSQTVFSNVEVYDHP